MLTVSPPEQLIDEPVPIAVLALARMVDRKVVLADRVLHKRCMARPDQLRQRGVARGNVGGARIRRGRSVAHHGR